MTQDRHGEINDNAARMLENARHPMRLLDRSNVATRTCGALPTARIMDWSFLAAFTPTFEDEL